MFLWGRQNALPSEQQPLHAHRNAGRPLGAKSMSAARSPWVQVLKTSTVGNTFSNLGRQLLDGHWVLSFIDADRCAAARDLIEGGQVHSTSEKFLPRCCHVNVW